MKELDKWDLKDECGNPGAAYGYAEQIMDLDGDGPKDFCDLTKGEKIRLKQIAKIIRNARRSARRTGYETCYAEHT